MTSTPLPQDSVATPDATRSLPPADVEEIYREFHQDLSAFLWGVLRDAHRSQDALQQTFQRLAENGGAIRRETIRGWLFQVAYREALQIRRSEQREARHVENMGKLSLTELGTSPADQLVSSEEAARLQQAVNELPLEQQVVVRRRIQQGETFAEIAASLGAPLGTVLTRMRLAVERLRKKLCYD